MKTYPLGKGINFYFTHDRRLRKAGRVLDGQFDLLFDVAWVYEYPDEDELEEDEMVYNNEYLSARVGVII